MPRTKKPKKASKQYIIGYARKSTDTEDKQIHSLKDQEKIIRMHYLNLSDEERHLHPLLFLNESKSAYRTGRPEFTKMIDMARRGEVKGVIVIHANRISRNPHDSGVFAQHLVEEQIHFLDIANSKRYTASDSNAIFMLTLENAMSWKDSRDKGDRIRQAMKLRSSEGRHMGPVRIGYRIKLDEIKGKIHKSLEIVPEYEPLIIRLFEIAATGHYSLRDLVKVADKMGLRSKKSGKKLEKTMIHGILRDPIYKGYCRFDGEVHKGKHQAIVDERLWHIVQQVLEGRNRNTARVKNTSLREQFVFGSLLGCHKCEGTLSPYLAKGKYVYYECKNSKTKCKVSIPQKTAMAQHAELLALLRFEDVELDGLREELLKEHKKRSTGELERRKVLEKEYKKVQQQIVEVFGQLKDAEKLGIKQEIEVQLRGLKQRRDELQGQLNETHAEGNDWIEKVVRSFELIKLMEEAVLYGSTHCREAILKSIASNYTVKDKTLVWESRSPFRQAAQKGNRSEWWAGLDSNQRSQRHLVYSQTRLTTSVPTHSLGILADLPYFSSKSSGISLYMDTLTFLNYNV